MKKNTVFLFDLDSTITTEEILPEISKKINKEKEMRELTEKTMMGEIGFEESFTRRVKILGDIPVDEVAKIVSQIKLEPYVINFIREHKDQCYIVTSNLNVWIKELVSIIGLDDHCFCSEALVENNKIKKIKKIFPKEEAIKEFKGKIVGIGDGSNDFELVKQADIGIAFGGVRNVAPCLLDVADYAIYDGKKLAEFLARLV